MSPGATFERVYRELKQRLADGLYAPGAPLEPNLLAADLAASITPVRDALHRLVGERLVEAPNHNGFRVHQFTEAGLRDLYAWNATLLRAAAKSASPDNAGDPTEMSMEGTDLAAATAELFLKIARASNNAEHIRAIEQLNDRLATSRRAEAIVIDAVLAELTGLTRLVASGDRAELGNAITRYHRRRTAAVTQIVAHLQMHP